MLLLYISLINLNIDLVSYRGFSCRDFCNNKFYLCFVFISILLIFCEYFDN